MSRNPPPRKTARSFRAQPAQIAILFLALGAGLVWSYGDLFTHRTSYGALFQRSLSVLAYAVLAVRWVVIPLFVLAVGWRAVRQVRHSPDTRRIEDATWFPLRIGIAITLAAIGVVSLALYLNIFQSYPPLLASLFYSSWHLCLAILLLVMLWRPKIFAPRLPAAVRALDVVLTNCVLVLLFCELLLLVCSRFSMSPLFWSDAGGEAEGVRTIQRYRLPPSTPGMNSLNYYDDEFFRAGKDDLVVALLTDSFGGMRIARKDHFSHVAERILEASLGGRFKRIDIQNFGVSAIGMREYAYILKTDAMQFDPSIVVLCVFIGNDIDGPGGVAWRPWFCLQNWWIAKVPRRIFITLRESRNTSLSLSLGKPNGQFIDVLPWSLDPSKEPPTLSVTDFLNMERERVLMCDTHDTGIADRYRRFFDILQWFSDSLGPKLLVMIVPDEYQISDNLWTTVLDDMPQRANCVRDYPQRLITAYCGKHGIDYLDLLPVLREAEKVQRTYHTRDTHFNTRGSRLVGEALAKALIEKIQSEAMPMNDAANSSTVLVPHNSANEIPSNHEAIPRTQ